LSFLENLSLAISAFTELISLIKLVFQTLDVDDTFRSSFLLTQSLSFVHPVCMLLVGVASQRCHVNLNAGNDCSQLKGSCEKYFVVNGVGEILKHRYRQIQSTVLLTSRQ
jgi:hypothetical protein